jgi:hypothetical protein
MTYQLSTVAAVAALSTVLVAPGLSAGQARAVKGTAPEALTWKLERLSQEPVKLLKATPDPTGTQVRFLVEFTRPLTLAEEMDWQRPEGLVVFRFLDEDGVVIRTVKPGFEGEMISKKGARLRIVLAMPDERTLAQTHSILAD